MQLATFGEIMMRLTPPSNLRLAQTTSLDITFGGGEANVAVALAMFGEQATFITRLPQNDIAENCIHRLRAHGVDTNSILRGGERVGVYFLEVGAAQRPSVVTYDRAHSALAEIDPAELDWEKLLTGADWFHFTGITPPLSDKAAQATLDGARTAKKMGLTVSCDLNFRGKLWGGKQPAAIMTPLMEFVDICIAGRSDAESFFDIKAADSDTLNHDSYSEVARKLTDRFNFKGVAITLRESFSASRNSWSGLYYTGGQSYISKAYDIHHMVDRVGTGDAFTAGLIYALGTKKSAQEAIEFAAAASCLNHSIHGDFSYIKRSEVEELMAGDGSGRVQR